MHTRIFWWRRDGARRVLNLMRGREEEVGIANTLWRAVDVGEVEESDVGAMWDT
jgi:hypothetical protein